MLSRLASTGERLRASLFFVPMLFVVGGLVLGQAMLAVDGAVTGIDDRFTATVDSARTVLTTVAGATLGFAGIAFSVSLLLISLASSQYSPRVVHGMFRDPFNKRVMGMVVGTFTYCLVVLRAVRSPLGEAGEAVVPSVSILVAVVLGIASVLSIIAFIDHAAHSMDISQILRRVSAQALAATAEAWPRPDSGAETAPSAARSGVEPDESLALPGGASAVRFEKHGWVQNVDFERLLTALPARSRARLETYAGQYAVQGTPLCHVFPPLAEGAGVAAAIRGTVLVGATRTLQQDVAYGVRQLADVALKAMSPGVNDPTTAHDAVSHLGTLLADMLGRLPPERRLLGAEGQVLLVPQATTHGQLVDLAFDEVRLASADHPTVLVYLLDVLHQVEQALVGLDRPAAVAALHAQADLVRAMTEEAEVPEADRERVRVAYARRYPG